MTDDFTTVMIDTTTRELLRSLANTDDRSMAAELRWLVNQETARRYSKPNAGITIEQAEQAAAGN